MLGRDGTTVQAIFIINQRFALKKLESIETVYSKLDKKYCFLPSETTYLTPTTVTKVVYFKYIHKNNEQDVLKRLGTGFGKYYLKMLTRAYELIDYLDTITAPVNEVRWFYYRNIYTYKFSYLNLFRNGEKIRTIRNLKRPYGTPIPTRKQLESLLIPQFFKDRLELIDTFLKWKKEQDISQIRDALHSPYRITDFLRFLMFYKYCKYWDSKKLKWYSIPKIINFKINEFLSLRLEKNKTKIYVDGQLFNQCKFLLFNISNEERPKYKDIDSIDEASELYDKTHENNHASLNPKTEFWGHCSNLQAWYENDYDTRILHSNLSFPLLERLMHAGDPLAKNVFKEEIALRIESEYFPVFVYIQEQKYLDYFTREELKIISKNLSHPILKIYLKHYFSFKKICAELKTLGTIKNQEILITSISPPPVFLIGMWPPKNPYSQEDLVNFSDFRASLSEFNTNHYKPNFLCFDKKLLVEEAIVDLCRDIFSKKSKTVLIKHDSISNCLDFFSITKKARISISLYEFNEMSGMVIKK